MKNLFTGLSPAKAARGGISICAAAGFLAGCAPVPVPSVPQQAGMSFQQARQDVKGCTAYAPKGGKDAVVGSYIAGVVLAGIVIGPVVIASQEEEIRAGGEQRAVDRCLEDMGYERRALTPAEIGVLKSSHGYDRQRLLNHLVAGGTLDTFS